MLERFTVDRGPANQGSALRARLPSLRRAAGGGWKRCEQEPGAGSASTCGRVGTSVGKGRGLGSWGLERVLTLPAKLSDKA